MNTKLSDAMDVAGLRAGYDRCVKVLLANKSILAWILKTCVSEFFDYEIDTIMQCIDNREISSKALHKDSSDAAVSSDEEIQGLNSEDTSLSEQTIYYDIRFTATVPETDSKVQLIINIEAQMNTSPGYPLEKRVIYYLSRMISAQYGTVFTKSHYEQIEKVYSIWFCPNPPMKERNTIRKIILGQVPVYGENKIDESVTDVMCGIIVNLGEAGQDMSNRILRLMNVLLSATMEVQTKKKILNSEFRIAMTNEMEGDFTKMCNLSQGIWDRAMEKGIAQGIAQGMAQGEARGMARGIEQGMVQGEIRSMDKTTKAMEMIVSRKYTVSEIAAKCEIPEAMVRTICSTFQIKLEN